MKKLLLLTGLLLASPAFALDNTVIVTPGTGVTMRSKDIGAGVESMINIIGDASGNPVYGTAGTANANILTVQGIASMTPLLATVTGAVIAQGTGAAGAAVAGNPFRVGLSDGTNSQNWLAAIALADGVNGNNTGAVAQWYWNGATFDRAKGDATNGAFVNVKTSVLPTGAATAAGLTTINTTLGTPFQAGGSIGNTTFAATQATSSNLKAQVDPLTAASWGIGTATQNSASATNGQLALGQFNTTPTTITTGNMSPLQMDSAGNLLVNIKAGAAAGGTSSNFGSAFPSAGTATGFSDGTNMVAGRVTTYGTAPTGLNAVAVNAFVTNTNANGQAVMASSSPVVIASNQSNVPVVNGASRYQAVAASQTAAVLQSSTGATGDYLSHCVIYPASTSPGVVTVFDSTNTAANSAILFAGGASSTSNLVPISVPVGAISLNGAWKVTTGTNVSVVCYGKFS